MGQWSDFVQMLRGKPYEGRAGTVAQFSKYELLVPWWARYNEELFVREAYRINPVVFASIEYVAKALSVATMYAWRDGANGAKKQGMGENLQVLLRRPSQLYPTQTRFVRQMYRQLAITGECFVHLARGRNTGRVKELQILPGSVIQVVPKKDGIARFEYRPNGETEPQIIKPRDMIFLRFDDPKDVLRGMSPLAVVWRETQTDNSMSDYRKAFFDNSAIPGGVLTTKLPANEEQLKQWAEDFSDKFSGAKNAGRTPALAGGLEYQRAGATPKEIDFGQVLAIPETRIPSVFGPDPSLIGLKAGIDSQNYSNRREARDAFWEDTVVPLMELIADEFTVALTRSNDPNFIAFDTSKVPALQQDANKKEERAKSALVNGGMTVNEYREEIGLNPVPDGDVYYRPSNVVPVPAGELDTPPPEPVVGDGATPTSGDEDGGRPAEPADELANPEPPNPDSTQTARSRDAEEPPAPTFDERLAEILTELGEGEHAERVYSDPAGFVARVSGTVRPRLRRLASRRTGRDISDWLDMASIDLGNRFADYMRLAAYDPRDAAVRAAADADIMLDGTLVAEEASEPTTLEAELETAEHLSDLSAAARAELDLEVAAIQTEVLEHGEEAYQFKGEWEDRDTAILLKQRPGPGHGPSIKCPDIYEALRRKGKSKKNAAQISNECRTDPNCNCH